MISHNKEAIQLYSTVVSEFDLFVTRSHSTNKRLVDF